jgi:DNA-damage-inducible protein J
MYRRKAAPMESTMVHVRVDSRTKRLAAKRLRALGLSVSDAVRMLLLRVAAEKALAFEAKVPNTVAARAMQAALKGKGKRLPSAEAVFRDLGI